MRTESRKIQNNKHNKKHKQTGRQILHYPATMMFNLLEFNKTFHYYGWLVTRRPSWDDNRGMPTWVAENNNKHNKKYKQTGCQIRHYPATMMFNLLEFNK